MHPLVRIYCLLSLSLVIPGTLIQTTHAHSFPAQPQTWRREAALEGREVLYNKSSFIHRFHYLALQAAPEPEADGLWGSVGSVSSDEQVSFLRIQDTLPFDGPGWLQYRFQRDEDFDGRYDRVWVAAGFDTPQHRLSVAADPHGDKADVALRARWQWQPVSAVQLDTAWTIADVFFNKKTAEDAAYETLPHSLFVSLQMTTPQDWRWRFTLDAVPEVVLTHQDLDLDLMAREVTWGAGVEVPGTQDSRLTVALSGVHVTREFSRLRRPAELETFRRTVAEAQVNWHWKTSTHDAEARVGYRFLRFEESGFLGARINLTGHEYHREHLWFVEYPWQLSERLALQPLLSVTRLRSLRKVDITDEDERDNREWFGKIALPWRFLLSRDGRGILTLAPSFYLHEAQFGGGNIQLEWHL